MFVVSGNNEALFPMAVSGVMVATNSSILWEQTFLKQLGQRQSALSRGLKIGGKSLHQQALPSAVSPQSKAI
ncbi:hypothetical protein EM308_17390 [Flavobacterium gilvum]|uniref:Uncharacterized protein n=1 Tax=Flavobacterium gilvum TaxID=1492737 RepID=A0AAC9N740_9FLAO|nr:hypothetical protein EM308_17390 [Flavobacterium gilvum]KFC61041.1 hypothetical protein FEM08_01630 [Flavobacterium gilvum]